MDNDEIIAAAAKRAGREGNERFFERLEKARAEEEEERTLLQDIWQRLGSKPDCATDPQYERLTKLLERKGWL